MTSHAVRRTWREIQSPDRAAWARAMAQALLRGKRFTLFYPEPARAKTHPKTRPPSP